MPELRYYLAVDGKSPFEAWFAGLDRMAAAKVTIALARLEQGNLSNAKGVGEGVLEYRSIGDRATVFISDGKGTCS